MFQYCPSCGKKNIHFKINRFHCPDCGFTYYHNTAAATGCVIQTGDKIVLLVRAKEPAKGKLDLPGGFVDPGEGILEGLYRELGEEINWKPPIKPCASLTDYFTFFASFPNTYLYKNISYNTCDLFFTISVPGLSEKDFRPETGEIAEIRFLRPDEIKSDDFAFDSTRRAIAAFIEYTRSTRRD